MFIANNGFIVPFFLLAPVIIGFDHAHYSVSEDVGSVQVCITVSGPPGVSVPVTVTAEDGTAQGTKILCMHVCRYKYCKSLFKAPLKVSTIC